MKKSCWLVLRLAPGSSKQQIISRFEQLFEEKNFKSDQRGIVELQEAYHEAIKFTEGREDFSEYYDTKYQSDEEYNKNAQKTVIDYRDQPKQNNKMLKQEKQLQPKQQNATSFKIITWIVIAIFYLIMKIL